MRLGSTIFAPEYTTLICNKMKDNDVRFKTPVNLGPCILAHILGYLRFNPGYGGGLIQLSVTTFYISSTFMVYVIFMYHVF